MTTTRAPGWTRIFSAVIGVGALVLSALCFFAPDLLLGLDAYRTLTRASLGLVGALTGGLGVTAIAAAVDGDQRVVRTMTLAVFGASALIPSVVIYNIGAFNQTDTTGIRSFGLAGGVILGVSLPSLLSLLVLTRQQKVAEQGPGALAADS